ncbi:MAG: tRNA glutamyl-Q(34) synthetase GluQRS [Planctomycetota bacterium]|nr:tRNA glutamyl-Q(34) synthetase GluQRS [Planctomycetota bacterium]
MVVGRLAPSPTGAQHLGNARTFLIAWLSIRSQNGHLILRIEDIDSPRVKHWAIQQAIEDLSWLGLHWDEGPGPTAQSQRYIQSQRLDLYLTALEKLKKAEAIYPCTCSRSDVANAASAPHELSDAPVYGRTCFHRHSKDALKLQEDYSWRYRSTQEPVHFVDGFKGSLQANIATELGDFVVFKSDRSPSYQLSVVVDDNAMGINEVLRGEDLVQSTFRQIALYDFFGWKPPHFIHAPLVVGPDGRRLAKRHGDTRISYFREKGVKPERIIGLLAHSLGWLDQPREVSAADLITGFSLGTIPDRPFVCGNAELEWLLK